MTGSRRPRLGVWLIGARGSVAVTTVYGALAVQHALAGPVGMVSELPEVAVANLPEVDALVFGGHDVVTSAFAKRVAELEAAGVLPGHLAAALRPQLDALDDELRPGIGVLPGTQAEQIEQVRSDITDFAGRHRLERVVVVDVSSTEAPVDPGDLPPDLDALDGALARGESPLPTSSAYALAAFRAGCPLVAFTPSPGPQPLAVAAAGQAANVPWAGIDGKTGETLVKSVLAPMFHARALRVRSWSGINLLGGGDGQTLADTDVAASKTATKALGVGAMLGHQVPGPVHIDYVPDLGDWKTAWDHISFEGFLGARMSMQFTWQGCDSALAAPLVLDLARLLARAHECGHSGPQAATAFFFKDPLASDEHGLGEQLSMLTRWCQEMAPR